MTVVNVDTGEIADVLSAGETRLLAACEAVLGDPDVGRGMALRDIRDGRLYRATHGTFEAYCQERWSLSRPSAYRLIEAASVVEALSPIGDIPKIANEAQARAIAPVLRHQGPEAAAEVLRKVAENGPMTAADIREYVASRADAPARRMSEHDLAVARERREAVDRKQPVRVVPLVNTVITHCIEAAAAADQITRSHLAARSEEAATWGRSLSHSMKSLERLLDALKEASAE